MILDDFEDASTAEPLKRLRVWMTVPNLGEIQRKTSGVLHLFGKLPKIIPRRADEIERLH